MDVTDMPETAEEIILDEQLIPFGAICKDKVTGFQGTVLGYQRHLTGCDQVVLVGKSLKGKPGRLKVVDFARVTQEGFHPDIENSAVVTDPHIPLGKRVRHLVSGHEGTVVTVTQLWGVDGYEYHVTPDDREDGEQQGAWYFGATLVVVDAEKVNPEDVQGEKPGADEDALASSRRYL